MPTKQVVIQLNAILPSPVAMSVNIDGTQVFSGNVTSQITFDLDLPNVRDSGVPAATTQTWAISVNGGPVTISGILNNNTSIPAVIPGPGSSQNAVLGNPDLYGAALIVSQPTFNGEENTSIYDVNTFITDGEVTGVGLLPIPDGTTVQFNLDMPNYSQSSIWSDQFAYLAGLVRLDVQGGTYFATLQQLPTAGIPVTDTDYWAPVTLQDGIRL